MLNFLPQHGLSTKSKKTNCSYRDFVCQITLCVCNFIHSLTLYAKGHEKQLYV